MWEATVLGVVRPAKANAFSSSQAPDEGTPSGYGSASGAAE